LLEFGGIKFARNAKEKGDDWEEAFGKVRTERENRGFWAVLKLFSLVGTEHLGMAIVVRLALLVLLSGDFWMAGGLDDWLANIFLLPINLANLAIRPPPPSSFSFPHLLMCFAAFRAAFFASRSSNKFCNISCPIMGYFGEEANRKGIEPEK
jgi:hypothetical protein